VLQHTDASVASCKGLVRKRARIAITVATVEEAGYLVGCQEAGVDVLFQTVVDVLTIDGMRRDNEDMQRQTASERGAQPQEPVGPT
jgi:hypothetical protein